MKNVLLAGATLLLSSSLTFAQNARAVLDQYCVSCHNDKVKTAGLMLDKMDPARVSDDAAAWEKVVRKLRAGMMPPQGRPRPDATAYEALMTGLETELDRAAAGKPKLAYRAGRSLHRRGLLSDARMEALRQKYGSADYRAASPVMRTVLVQVIAESYDEELRALRCPASLVWGARDTVVPLAMLEKEYLPQPQRIEAAVRELLEAA